MKRILFIAPSSYPVNGPEAMVNAKHIYALTEAGYDVDLMCRGVRENSNFYPSESNAPYFFHKVKSIHTIKVDTQWNINTLFRHFKVLAKTGYIYKAADWSVDAIKYCEENLNISDYDYVFTKDYPSEIVGVYLAKKYNIRWIPTWNDPYMLKKYPFPYGEGTEYRESFFRMRLIKDIGKYAYKHIFPSPRLRNYMLSYMYGMNEKDCVVMPHILVERSKDKGSSLSGETLKIIHAGSIGIQRDPMNLLRALKKFIDCNPERKVELTFLGIIQGISEEVVMGEIKRLGLEQSVSFHKPVKYDESFRIVEKYDVCLILEAPCNEGIFLPSKLIDYLQNNKPVFSLSPKNGTLNDLYSKRIVDYFADVTSVESIYTEMGKIYNDFVNEKMIKDKNLSDFEISGIIDLHKNVILK